MREGTEKTAGRLRVKVSATWPYWFTVGHLDRGDEIRGLTIEEARDLHYMLGRLIQQVEEAEAKK